MHEYSIVEALVSQVEETASARGASAVRKLHVSIGEVSGVERDLLATAFLVFRAHTMCADATLELTAVSARWACPGCERPIKAGEILRCSDCQRPARLVAGGDIMLDRIELEVPDV